MLLLILFGLAMGVVGGVSEGTAYVVAKELAVFDL